MKERWILGKRPCWWKETCITRKRPVYTKRNYWNIRIIHQDSLAKEAWIFGKRPLLMERDRYWWKETVIDGKRPAHPKRDMNTLNETAETYKTDFKTALWKRPILMERDLYWWEETFIDGKRPEYLPNAQDYWIYTYLINNADMNLLLSTDTRKETHKRDVYTQKEACIYVKSPVSI